MSEITSIYNKIVAKMPNSEPRLNQLQMAISIKQHFAQLDQDNSKNIALIEAPTGTGKSLAYILAGVVSSRAQAKSLVISTATKTLQSQLITKDIPNFIKHSGINLSVVVAKGRANYLCPYKLEMNLFQPDILQPDSSNKLKQILSTYEDKSWDGDLDHSIYSIEPQLKSLITTDRHQCLANECPHNQKNNLNCPFYQNREQLKRAELIIINHSLLLADLNSGGAVLAKQPKDYLLIIDEAHSLINYSLNSFANSLELKTVVVALTNLAKLLINPKGHFLIKDKDLCQVAAELIATVQTELNALILIFKTNLNLFQDQTLLLNNYLNLALATDIDDKFIIIATAATELITTITKIQEKLKQQSKNLETTPLTNVTKVGDYLAKIISIKECAAWFNNVDDSAHNAIARFVEHKIVKTGEEFILKVAMIHVGKMLYEQLWSQVGGAVLTSATLAIGEDFSYFKTQLGLNLLTDITQLKLDSNFDYKTHGRLALPNFRYTPDFKTRTEFAAELQLYLNQVLNYDYGYGTLVLFFNRSQLNECYQKLPLKLQSRVLVQSMYSSNQKLLNDHCLNIDKGLPAIIFGLNSFAAGVDLPLKYCMHVIITKLPFDAFKDPINVVREYWIKRQGNNYFMEISLPETCLRLTQAVGRLIRSKDDYGLISICDNRISTKSYGKILLKSLPQFGLEVEKDFIDHAFTKIN